MTELIGTTNCYKSGEPGSLIMVIPKEIRDKLGLKSKTHFKVLLDSEGRIIYERINE